MNSIVKLDVGFLAIVAGTFIPIVVALVTKWKTSSGVKAVVNGLLAAVAGAVAVATQANGVVNVRNTVGAIALAWLTSVATYYGLWKPTGIANAVGEKTQNVGIGSNQSGIPGA